MFLDSAQARTQGISSVCRLVKQLCCQDATKKWAAVLNAAGEWEFGLSSGTVLLALPFWCHLLLPVHRQITCSTTEQNQVSLEGFCLLNMRLLSLPGLSYFYSNVDQTCWMSSLCGGMITHYVYKKTSKPLDKTAIALQLGAVLIAHKPYWWKGTPHTATPVQGGVSAALSNEKYVF